MMKKEHLKVILPQIFKMILSYVASEKLFGYVRFSYVAFITDDLNQLGLQSVHHADQPMPGGEQEEFKMVADTEIAWIASMCMKKEAIMHHIWHTTKSNNCLVQDCKIALCASRVVCDALLHVEIEPNASTKQTNSDSRWSFQRLDYF
ncbi:E3 SUMO-protein ligase MMS21-like [Silene latifolia]|uniref:E3 SUMO-protein ligase MMS21-like n=1 Tax=Silene latifolia TaxID=37657 RepID=UPI003D7720C4